MTSLKRHFLRNFSTDFAENLFEDANLMLNKVPTESFASISGLIFKLFGRLARGAYYTPLSTARWRKFTGCLHLNVSHGSAFRLKLRSTSPHIFFSNLKFNPAFALLCSIPILNSLFERTVLSTRCNSMLRLICFRLTVTIVCKMSFRDYPFDSQHCVFHLEDCKYSSCMSIYRGVFKRLRLPFLLISTCLSCAHLL